MREKQLQSSRGFTLIELVIVVAIVAILAGIAYPSYQEQIRKARRTDAQGVLFENAQFMERLYTETGCYNPGPDNDCQTAGDAAAPTLPYPKSPADGDTKYYDLTVDSIGATSYTLEAAPDGSQSHDSCGDMSLNNVGTKTAAEENCWRK